MCHGHGVTEIFPCFSGDLIVQFPDFKILSFTKFVQVFQAVAKYNKDTGKLSWDLNLQPNETKKIVFKYEVKYPKDKQVNGL